MFRHLHQRDAVKCIRAPVEGAIRAAMRVRSVVLATVCYRKRSTVRQVEGGRRERRDGEEKEEETILRQGRGDTEPKRCVTGGAGARDRRMPKEPGRCQEKRETAAAEVEGHR